jgi:hypothetical protein
MIIMNDIDTQSHVLTTGFNQPKGCFDPDQGICFVRPYRLVNGLAEAIKQGVIVSSVD